MHHSHIAHRAQQPLLSTHSKSKFMDDELYSKNLARRFKTYSSDMKDVWESYCFIGKYMEAIHPLIKDDVLPPFAVVPLASEDDKEQATDKKNTFGYIDHIIKKVNPSRSLITAVALTEDFLQDMVKNVYTAYPENLSGGDSKDAPERVEKVVDVILRSDDKDEIINKLIEEKVRGIFYGNPVDFFLKDKKLKLKFGTLFKDNHSKNIEIYSEIVARRNIYAHNGGRVDRKYAKESGASNVKLGNKIKIIDDYLKESIQILRGLSSVAAFTVCKRIFSSPPPGGRLFHVYRDFDKRFSDNARKSA
jgi:hypothetical protein